MMVFPSPSGILTQIHLCFFHFQTLYFNDSIGSMFRSPASRGSILRTDSLCFFPSPARFLTKPRFSMFFSFGAHLIFGNIRFSMFFSNERASLSVFNTDSLCFFPSPSTVRLTQILYVLLSLLHSLYVTQILYVVFFTSPSRILTQILYVCESEWELPLVVVCCRFSGCFLVGSARLYIASSDLISCFFISSHLITSHNIRFSMSPFLLLFFLLLNTDLSMSVSVSPCSPCSPCS